jgi:septation ring formation regulator EzrA
MADIELNRAVELWKRVKPLLLTETGISEKLRGLSSYPKTPPKKKREVVGWVKKLDEIILYLKAQQTNKHVLKHSKVVTWLSELEKQLVTEKKKLSSIEFDKVEEANHQFHEQAEEVKELWTLLQRDKDQHTLGRLVELVSNMRRLRGSPWADEQPKSAIQTVWKNVYGESLSTVLGRERQSKVDQAIKDLERVAK